MHAATSDKPLAYFIRGPLAFILFIRCREARLG